MNAKHKPLKILIPPDKLEETEKKLLDYVDDEELKKMDFEGIELNAKTLVSKFENVFFQGLILRKNKLTPFRENIEQVF